MVIVSNRGPVSFRAGDGDLEARRGAGGLVTGLGSLADSGATWIAAALTGGDREAAERQGERVQRGPPAGVLPENRRGGTGSRVCRAAAA